MKIFRLTRSLLAITLMSQLMLADIALAAEGAPTAQASPAASASPSPSATHNASPSPSPTPSTSPSPSPAARAEASPSPTSSASPTPTASPEHKKTKDGRESHDGTVPKWVFDTASGTWIQAEPNSFAYDPASGYWLSPKYYYDTQSGWYKVMPAASAAGSATLVTAPHTVTTPAGVVAVGSPDYVAAQKLGLIDANGSPVHAQNGGPQANTSAGEASTANGWVDLTNLVNIVNTLRSTAASGNNITQDNTKAGDTTTGSAMVVANLINLLSSAWSWSNGSLNFFMKNLFGDQTGDLTLQPGTASAGGGGGLGATGGNGTSAGSTGPNSSTSTSQNDEAALTVRAKQSGAITNDVNLNATSGDATAQGNTQAGNVTSGDATAQANIINLINSFITSGDSFFGILNIFGNLNGDVLFPQGFLDGAQTGSNTAVPSPALSGGVSGPGSSSVSNGSTSDSARLVASQRTGIANNIDNQARSGAVTNAENTSSGSAQSGSATSQNNLFNLVNQSVNSDNAVLVMVNVLGRWVGKIMSLPGGGSTSSALLTSGATSVPQATGAASGPGSVAQQNNAQSRTADVGLSTDNAITNNLKLTAQSGDATARKNTVVGDVKSGAAKVASSAANIVNSAIAVKHWFGVLVVNVFGDWTGDVNHDSAAGGSGGKGASNASATKSLPGRSDAAQSVQAAPARVQSVPMNPTAAVVSAATPAEVHDVPLAKITKASAHPALVAAASNQPTTTSQGYLPMALLVGSSLLLIIGFVAGIIERKGRHTRAK